MCRTVMIPRRYREVQWSPGRFSSVGQTVVERMKDLLPPSRPAQPQVHILDLEPDGVIRSCVALLVLVTYTAESCSVFYSCGAGKSLAPRAMGLVAPLCALEIIR